MFWLRTMVFALALGSACSGDKQKRPTAEESGDHAGSTATAQAPATAAHPSPGEPEIDERTGLIKADGFAAVVSNCTVCHSGRLIAQNRGTRRDWDARLRWMQVNHNLWQLPDQTRARILDYLAANYGVDDEQARYRRRANLPDYLMPPTKAELQAPSTEP